MRLAELKGFGDWVAGTALANDRLWQRDLDVVSELEVQLLYARAGLRRLKPLAVEAIDRLQSALLINAIDGEPLSPAAMKLIGHEPPSDPYIIDEFLDSLVKLRPARRAATLFALYQKIEPQRVADLTWAQAKLLAQLKPAARELLATQGKTRHMQLPYVFWEWMTPTSAGPLLRLEEDAERAFEARWPTIQVKFDDMLWISGRADCASFLGIVDEVAKGRL